MACLQALQTNLQDNTSETFTVDEIVAHLVDAEWDERQGRSIEQKIKNARFRYKAALEDLNYNADRNIDKNQIAAEQYNVRAVPTFIIFKNGQQVWRHAGMIDKNSLEKQLLAFA